MCPLDDWIKTLPKQDQPFVAETLSELWDIFEDLEQKGYLKPTLRNKKRKDFVEIIGTSNGLFEAFNILLSIPYANGNFVKKRNEEFVNDNKKYGFHERGFVHLLLSESMSVFLRNVELFRSCFLFVLKTKKRKKGRKGFYHTMGIGELLNQLVSICGSKGEKIKDKIDWELRNGLTHGLVWTDKLTIRYSKDIAFTEQGEIRLDDLWKIASDQSKVTQCLINLVPAWYSRDC
jgi:hypothetical protein